MTRTVGMLAAVAVSAIIGAGCGGAGEPAGEPPAEPGAASAIGLAEGCEPSAGLQYVCGPLNAEDIVQLGTSDWLIVSGMNGQLSGAEHNGHLYLVDHRQKRYEEWFPGTNAAFTPDGEMFGACPGPLDTTNFSAHGLALREQSAGRYRLYMTSHGAREAIEVFDVDATGARPTLAWVGCVVLPDTTFANSVAILSDGGFVTTKMMDPTVPNAFAQINQGAITGSVFEWRPGGEVTAVPGTELSGANGIVVSPDDRAMFVTAIGSRELVRFDRTASPVSKQAVELPIGPDNIRWTADGTLYTVGGNYVPPAECATPPCATGWSVIEVEPDTLEATRVAGADETAALQGASTALLVGDEIWVGTFRGDRVAYLPAR